MASVLHTNIEKITTSPRNYWFGLIMNIIVGALLIVYGLINLTSYWMLLLIPVGFFGFSFIEYCFHRWVFHKEKSPAYKGHSQHHDAPKSLMGLPWFLPQLVVIGLVLLFTFISTITIATLIVGSMLLGYAYYGSLHHLQHHKKAFKLRHYRKLHAFHNAHHTLRNYNYGVTTSLWDHIFRTHQKYYKKN